MVSMLFRRFSFFSLPLARPFGFRQVSRQMKWSTPGEGGRGEPIEVYPPKYFDCEIRSLQSLCHRQAGGGSVLEEFRESAADEIV